MLYINGEKQDVDKVIKEFNVPIPETKVGVLELDASQVRPDYANGGIKHTVEKGILAYFRGRHPSKHTDLEITYSEAAPKKLQDGRLVPSPRIIGFPGHKMRLDMTDAKEKWVYLWLHKRCGDSPFNRNGEKWYKVFDPTAIATQQNANDDVLTDCLVAIRETTGMQLIHKAKGLNISTYEKKEVEIRAELNSRAKANPARFIKEFTEDTIEWKGTIRDAIDNQIFIQKNHMGMQRWFWGDKGARQGKEICIIDKGADAFDTLVIQISQELTFYRAELKRIYDGAVAETVIKEELKTPVDETVTETKLGAAIRKLNDAKMFHVEQSGSILWSKDDSKLGKQTTDNLLADLEAIANNDASIRMKFIQTARHLK